MPVILPSTEVQSLQNVHKSKHCAMVPILCNKKAALNIKIINTAKN